MRTAQSFSRRDFLAGASSVGALYAASKMLPLQALAQGVIPVAPGLANDPRVSPQPILNRGWAQVRQVGRGVYATIGDRTVAQHGRSNGGFVVGRDAALLFDGMQTPTGAALQLEALRSVTQLPVRAAIISHWHHDHILGSSFYAGQGIEVWAHAKVPERMLGRYLKWQAEDRATFAAPWERRVREARTDTQRQRAQGDMDALLSMYDPVKQYVLAVPNRLLDPARFPVTVDLGGVSAVIEYHPGHTDTDIIVRVPEQNVAFMGDSLAPQYPTNIDGAPKDWRAASAKYAAFDRSTIFVPGHGGISDIELAANQVAIFDDIAAQAKQLFDAGVPAAEAAQRYVVPEKWRGLRMFSWGFTVGRTIEQLYVEWGRSGSVLSYT
jgi:glyoxylase-like metal-dependent hydrolase (beta-lactamase superfamily II)